CLVADALGMTNVLIHPFSSLLSAHGMGLADIRSVRQQAVEEPFDKKVHATLENVARKLGGTAASEVAEQGVAPGKIKVHVRAHIRYAGTDTALIVDAFVSPGPSEARSPESITTTREYGFRASPPTKSAVADLDPKVSISGTPGIDGDPGMTLKKMTRAFERAHKARFGFIDRTKSLVLEAVSVEAVGGGARFKEQAHRAKRGKLPAPARRTRFFSGGKWRRASVYVRDTL